MKDTIEFSYKKKDYRMNVYIQTDGTLMTIHAPGVFVSSIRVGDKKPRHVQQELKELAITECKKALKEGIKIQAEQL